jgi:hypothetical protein
MLGERAGGQLVVCIEFLQVRGVDRDDVEVRGEQMPALEFAQAIRGLALQRRFHLLGNDAAAEDPGEGVTDGALQTSLETRDDAHTGLPSMPALVAYAVCLRQLIGLCRPGVTIPRHDMPIGRVVERTRSLHDIHDPPPL